MLQDSQPMTYDPLLNFKVVSGALYSDSKNGDLAISSGNKPDLMSLVESASVLDVLKVFAAILLFCGFEANVQVHMISVNYLEAMEKVQINSNALGTCLFSIQGI